MPSAGRRRTYINHTIRHEVRYHARRFQRPADPEIPCPLEPLSLAPYPSLTALPQASSLLSSPTHQFERGIPLQIFAGTDPDGCFGQFEAPRSSPSTDSILGRRRRSSGSPSQPRNRRTRPRIVYPVPGTYDPLSWSSRENRRSSMGEDHTSISPVTLLPGAAFNRRNGVPDVHITEAARGAQDARQSRGAVSPQEVEGVQRPTTETVQAELEGSSTGGIDADRLNDSSCDRDTERQT